MIVEVRDVPAATRDVRAKDLSPLHLSLLLLLILLSVMLAACTKSGDDAIPVPGEDNVGELAPGESDSGRSEGERSDTAGPVITDTVVLVTDSGEVTIGLYGEDAPKAVENFLTHAEADYYDSIRFHRVVEDYIVQSGDPLTRDTAQRSVWGTGGASIWGEPFEDELDPTSPSGRLGYRAGTVAMVNNGAKSNRSQFFIVLSNEQGVRIPYTQTIFGTVLEGMEVVRKIESTGRVTLESADGKGTEEAFVQTPKNPAMLIDIEIP